MVLQGFLWVVDFWVQFLELYKGSLKGSGLPGFGGAVWGVFGFSEHSDL